MSEANTSSSVVLCPSCTPITRCFDSADSLRKALQSMEPGTKFSYKGVHHVVSGHGYASCCNRCKGKGYIATDTIDYDCLKCGGTGLKIMNEANTPSSSPSSQPLSPPYGHATPSHALYYRSSSYPFGDLVPRAIRAKQSVSSSVPSSNFTERTTAHVTECCEYDAWVDSDGNVSADLASGARLSLDPAQYKVIKWWAVDGRKSISEDRAFLETLDNGFYGKTGWRPITENINALPPPLRRYIHNIETNCDLAGIIAGNAAFQDQIIQLSAALKKEREVAKQLREDVVNLAKKSSPFQASAKIQAMNEIYHKLLVRYYDVERELETLKGALKRGNVSMSSLPSTSSEARVRCLSESLARTYNHIEELGMKYQKIKKERDALKKERDALKDGLLSIHSKKTKDSNTDSGITSLKDINIFTNLSKLGMDFHNLLGVMCDNLAEGYSIEINAEKGECSINLLDFEGNDVEFCRDNLSDAGVVIEAIRVSNRKSGEHNRSKE